MNDVLALGVAVLLLLLNGFFVAAEFAVVTVRRSQIEPLAKAGSRSAQVTLRAMENVTLMIATAQVGITLCSVGLGAVAEPALAHLLEPVLGALGLPEAVVHPVGFVIALLVVVSLHVVVGEMIPKNLAVALPTGVALVIVPMLVAVARALRPVVVGLNTAANSIVRVLGVTPRDEVASGFTLDEVRNVVSTSVEHGTLDADTDVLEGVIAVGDVMVGSLAVPLGGVAALPQGATAADVEQLVARTGYSRFPILAPGGTPTGYLHIKDVLDVAESGRSGPLPAMTARPLPQMRADTEGLQALNRMRQSGAHLALVVDPGSPPLGLLFLEDLVEAIIGEVRDADSRQRSR